MEPILIAEKTLCSRPLICTERMGIRRNRLICCLPIMICIKSMALLLLLLSFFPSPSIAENFHLCGNTEQNFTNNSTYSSNLNILLSTLSSNPSAKAFASSTIGTDPDKVYGFAFCRGDVDNTYCTACISAAISDIQNLCQNNKVGVVWYDYCQLFYSNQDVIHEHDLKHMYQYILVNNNNVSADEVLRFESVIIALMENVSVVAVRNTSRLFATGEAALTATKIIYGQVQCALDLSGDECRSCLQVLVDAINLDDRKLSRGRRAMGMWCNMRYDFYKFYNGNSTLRLSSDLPPSSPPVLSHGGMKITTRRKVAIFLSLGISLLISIIVCLIWMMKKRGKGTRKLQKGQTLSIQGIDIASMLKMRETNMEFLLINFSSIVEATSNFSAANKLGHGGFGSVYKGQLREGESIAVKRLDKCSGQGLEEFMNEINLIAKLQHRNLVKLLGFSVEGDEKLLVYEYMPNKSLDYHLFDIVRKQQLHWSKRFSIIEGIAQGLLYLHKCSRVRIIHRDLKASNILLDLDMNPKISDFGMARIFDANTTQANTNRIVGTYGYMSPEYAMEGLFSIKSDVFSFGVLILEIISGKRNSTFHKCGKALNLLAYAWELWKNGYLLDFVDPTLGDKIIKHEVSICIIVALMCVQENAIDRPKISEIIAMLGSENTSLLHPKKPAFFTIENEGASNLSRQLATQNGTTFTILEGR